MERLNDIINRAAQRRQQAQEQHGRDKSGPYESLRQPQAQRPDAANQHYTPSMPQVPPTPIVQQTRQMPAYRHTRPAAEPRTMQEQKGMPQGAGETGQSGMNRGVTGQGAINHAPTGYGQQVPTNRSRYTQEEPSRPTPQIAPHLSQTAARPTHSAYARQQRLMPKTPSPYPLQQRQEERGNLSARSSYYSQEQANAAPSTYSHRDYQHNAGGNYHAPQPADVLDEDEDEATMQYGDWEENDEDAASYQQVEHGRDKSGPYDSPQHTYTPAATVHEPYGAYAPEVEPPAPQARYAQEMHRPTVTKYAPITHIQEIPNHHHKTQPLDPADTRFPATAQQPSRQLVTRDALTPVSTSRQMMAKMICPKCKGAGYRRADVPFGHPNFGKPIACECKEAERKEKRRQQLIELSDLSAFHDKHFDNFNTRFPGIHPSVGEAWKEAYHFAQNPKGWLIFIGTNGCGKTHLASAIANQCLNDSMMVLFSVVPELLDHLRSAFAPTATQVYDQLFSKMREAELLVLDDLGAHYSTPWATEKLYQLLNYRYSWSMPTVITTNNVGLQSIDIRLSSRMMDSSLVTIVNLEHAKDRRPYLPRRDM